MVKGNNIEFRKIRIFAHNSVLNYYSTVKKFHMRRLDLSTKNRFRRFLNLRFLGGKSLNFEDSDFQTKLVFNLLYGKEISHEGTRFEF